MVSSGPPNSIGGGAQSLTPSLLRSNSALLDGAQAGSAPSQSLFSSLLSPRTQIASNNLLGNVSNVPSLLNHSLTNGGLGAASGVSMPQMNLQQRAGLDAAGNFVNSAGPDFLPFGSSSGAPLSQHGSEQPQPQQQEAVQDFRQHSSVPFNQQQLKGGPDNGGNTGVVKLEPPQTGPTNQNGLTHTPCSLGPMKIEPQQLQMLRSLGPVDIGPQHLLQLSRQPHNSQVAAAQMSLLQLQQQQQQQLILKNLPQQRSQLQPQMIQQNLPLRTQAKPNAYEPGTCARRLTHYMYHQQHRPQDNNIQYWRNFVNEYFSPNAKKRWCVSLYGSGRQTTGVFPQDMWHCEICNRKPGRGFETTVVVLPRLCQIKYASGTLEELLYVDMPREYQNASGQIVLDYAKAVQEGVFEQLRVVREGQLRIIFNPDLKIASWEFCAKHHEELIPRRSLMPQLGQLGAVVQKYQAAVQGLPGLSAQDLQIICNSFVASGRQLAKALDVPLVNDLGYTKRYVRCLQIAEVVNCMKDLIDYSRHTGTGPMESLNNFPRRTSSGVASLPAQQPEDPQSVAQSSNHNDQKPMQATGAHAAASNGADITANNSLNYEMPTSTPTPTPGLQNTRIASNGPLSAGNNIQIPSTSSSAAVPPMQSNPNASANLSAMQPPVKPQDADLDSQSSVERILQEMMMASQLNGVGTLRSDMKRINGITSNSGIGSTGFGGMDRLGPSSTTVAMNRNVMVNHNSQDPTVMSQLFGGLRTVNSSNNLQYNWK